MLRAIILHGMPSKEEYYNASGDSQSNSHWLPWLQQRLCTQNVLAQTPEMPRPYQPDYEVWLEEFERYEPEKADVLVGHSCGGGFLLRWLAEKNEKIPAKIVLVAPWLDVEKNYRPFFDFILPHDVSKRTGGGIDLLASTDDMDVILSSVDFLRSRVEDIRYHEFDRHGHFCLGDMKKREFPELLDICLDGLA